MDASGSKDINEQKTEEERKFEEWGKNNKLIIHLTAKEGVSYDVPAKVARHSKYVVASVSDESSDNKVPVPSVASNELKRVIDFLHLYEKNYLDKKTRMPEIKKPIEYTNMKELVGTTFGEWIDHEEFENQELLFGVLLAANYMDIKPLLDLMCAKVASMIKGRSPEEIRKKFSIINDYTPEEEAAIIAENKWAEES
jgi:S-phase kinase-associated protein 1